MVVDHFFEFIELSQFLLKPGYFILDCRIVGDLVVFVISRIELFHIIIDMLFYALYMALYFYRRVVIFLTVNGFKFTTIIGDVIVQTIRK